MLKFFDPVSVITPLLREAQSPCERRGGLSVPFPRKIRGQIRWTWLWKWKVGDNVQGSVNVRKGSPHIFVTQRRSPRLLPDQD